MEKKESRRDRRRRERAEKAEAAWEKDRPKGMEARQVYPPPPEGPEAMPPPLVPEAPGIPPGPGAETRVPPAPAVPPLPAAGPPPEPHVPAAGEPAETAPAPVPEGFRQPAGAPPGGVPPGPVQPPVPAPEEYTPPPAPVVHEYPDSGAVPGGEAPPVPPEGATQVEYPQQPQPPDYYGQGYWTPFGWYPPPYPPPGYGYGPGYQLSPDQTVQIPVVPPVPPPGYPPVLPVPPEGASFFPLPAANEEAEFRELAREETPLWRVDFKWVFGLVTALFLLITLTLAGFYRVTGPGASRHVLAPLIERSTEVKESVRKNYQDIKKLARKAKNANIAIPDVGVDITIKSDVIKSLSADDLAERVIGEITRQAYSRGYSGDLPMKRAVGAGEERGKATSATYLALLNRKNHRSLILPLAVCGGITLAFAILFLIFCRRWGKLTGLGLAFIVGSLPGSLLIRIGSEFFWNVNTTGVYRGAMYQAFRSTGALMSAYYDIALALGALILLVGVIVGLVARRARERVPPFLDLKEPEEAVAGGPPIEAGLLPPQPAPDIQETEKEPTASGQ